MGPCLSPSTQDQQGLGSGELTFRKRLTQECGELGTSGLNMNEHGGVPALKAFRSR